MIAHFHERGEMSGGWGFWVLLVGLLVVLALIVLAFLAFRGNAAHRGTVPGAPPSAWGPPAAGRGADAERILAERFARGEIDDEEYQRRLKVLRGPD